QDAGGRQRFRTRERCPRSVLLRWRKDRQDPGRPPSQAQRHERQHRKRSNSVKEQVGPTATPGFRSIPWSHAFLVKPPAVGRPFNGWMVRCSPQQRLRNSKPGLAHSSGARPSYPKMPSTLCISIMCSRYYVLEFDEIMRLAISSDTKILVLGRAKRPEKPDNIFDSHIPHSHVLRVLR